MTSKLPINSDEMDEEKVYILPAKNTKAISELLYSLGCFWGLNRRTLSPQHLEALARGKRLLWYDGEYSALIHGGIVIGLNLGAGRAHFPSAPDNPMIEHVRFAIEAGCPEIFDQAVAWFNIDRARLDGIDEVVNLFRYPWIKLSDGQPFPDNFADIIWCAHIVEHIPHKMELAPEAIDEIEGQYGLEYRARAIPSALTKMAENDEDGWFAFFYECWRILKPGGKLHVIAPWGWSTAGIADPTHTRYVIPPSFGYFERNPKAPFDYELPFEFKQVAAQIGGGENTMLHKLIGKSAKMEVRMADIKKKVDALMEAGETNDLRLYLAELKAVQDEFEDAVFNQINQVETFYLAFTPMGK